MKLVTRNGYYHIKYYEGKYGYSRTKTTGLKATQNNHAAASKALKEFQRSLYSENRDFVFANIDRCPQISELSDEIKVTMSYSASTRDLYRLSVKHFTDVNGDLSINKYSKKHFIAFIKSLEKVSQNTRSIYSRTLHHLFEYAIKQKYIKENIIIRQPEQLKGARPLNEVLREDVFGKVKEKRIDLYLFLKLQYLTGGRTSTLVKLQREDILLDKNLIRLFNVKIHKTEYYYPITKQIKSLLDECEDYINSRDGNLFVWSDPDAVRRAFKRLKVGNIKLHQLKHSYVTEMVNKRININDLSFITNTSMRTLRKYYTQYDLQRIGKDIDESNVEIKSQSNPKQGLDSAG